MNFGKIFDSLKGPLAAVASTMIPGGPAILAAVNAFLPDEKKLPDTATGGDIVSAVGSLPPEQRSSLMEKQIDLEIEKVHSWTDIQKSLNEADASGASTRPWIAKMMATIVAIAVLMFMVVWALAIGTGDAETLKALSDSWAMMLTVLGTPTALLRAYFGMRTKEKQARYSAASGQPMAGGISSLIGILKG